MFSRKTKAPTPEPVRAPVPPGPTRKWSNLDAGYQPISMDVKALTYTVKPRVAESGLPCGKCTFQAVCSTPGFQGVLVLGELESYEKSDDFPGMLVDLWKKAPAEPNGFANLVPRDPNAFDGSFFSFTLFCTPPAFFSVIDVLSKGISSNRQQVRINAHLVHPDHFKQPNYWDVDWRADTLQVYVWDVVDSVTLDGYVWQ
jgi:hypothetical protein